MDIRQDLNQYGAREEISILSLPYLRSLLFGILLSASPLAVLAHGFLGAGAIVTGALLAVPLALLIVFGDWESLRRPNACDLLFAAFAALAVASLAINGVEGNTREAALLVFTLAAYPAARLSGRNLYHGGAIAVLAAVTLVGTAATAWALVEQWYWPHGKPMVFGAYDAAPGQFAMVGGLALLLALSSGTLTGARALVAGVLTLLVSAVLAASIVRFTFIAIPTALVVIAWFAPTASERKTAVAFILLIVVGVGAGVTARGQMSAMFLNLAAGKLESRPAIGTEPGCAKVDLDNSVAIRRQLYADAFRLLPDAGPFGIGLDQFSERACVKGIPPHNAFLQAALEFGWPAGAVLVLLVVTAAGRRSFAMAPLSREHAFAIAALLYVVMLAMVHGRISRETTLFLLLGYAAELRASAGSMMRAWLLRPL